MRRRCFSQRANTANCWRGFSASTFNAHPIPGGIERVERRLDILLITHTAKLARPTDKNRRPETTETTVTQGISICVFGICISWNRTAGATGETGHHRQN
jgi:hypothetical protein